MRDADGAEVADGDPGTIHIASPDTMLGYLETADGALCFAAPLLDDRWLDTGDIGTLDGDGQLRITGRSKEVIIRGGVNISPGEIERVLTGHAGVEHAAVVGIPHEILGEDVAAVIVPRDGGALEALEPELKALARESLDGSQQPAVFLQIDELPLTPTGKVLTGALRDLVIDRLELPMAKRLHGGPGRAHEPRAARLHGADRGPHPSAAGGHDLLPEPQPRAPGGDDPRPPRRRGARQAPPGPRHAHRHTHGRADALLPGGGTVDQLSLETLIGPAHVLTSRRPSRSRRSASIADAPRGRRLRHPRALLRSDWSERFGRLEFHERRPTSRARRGPGSWSAACDCPGWTAPRPMIPAGLRQRGRQPNHHILLGPA